MQPELAPAVGVRRKATLQGDDLVNISRLLGLYNRLKNQAAVIDATARMVAIPTVRSDKVPPHEDKHIIAFGALVEGMARSLACIPQRGQRIFEVKLPGSGPEEFGILTHADVVPWWPTNGCWTTAPNSTLQADPRGRQPVWPGLHRRQRLHRHRAVRHEGREGKRPAAGPHHPPHDRNHRRNRWRRDEVLPRQDHLPEYNIVLDSKYPAVVAERDRALRTTFALGAAAGNQPTIVAMAGAASANAVPQTATARLRGGDGKCG